MKFDNVRRLCHGSFHNCRKAVVHCAAYSCVTPVGLQTAMVAPSLALGGVFCRYQTLFPCMGGRPQNPLPEPLCGMYPVCGSGMGTPHLPPETGTAVLGNADII